MTPNKRCIFSCDKSGLASHISKSSDDDRTYCGIWPIIRCDGLKDKHRCPFWAIVNALSRIETAIQMLEVRE